MGKILDLLRHKCPALGDKRLIAPSIPNSFETVGPPPMPRDFLDHIRPQDDYVIRVAVDGPLIRASVAVRSQFFFRGTSTRIVGLIPPEIAYFEPGQYQQHLDLGLIAWANGYSVYTAAELFHNGQAENLSFAVTIPCWPGPFFVVSPLGRHQFSAGPWPVFELLEGRETLVRVPRFKT